MLLDLLFPTRAKLDSGWSSGWFGSRGKTNAGVVIDEELALTYSAVFRATGAIVQPLSTMPIAFYEKTNDGQDRRIADSCADLAQMLNVAPNEDMTAMPWREGRGVDQVNWGNGFAEIVRYKGEIVALNPIHAGRVRPGRGTQYGEPWPYVVRNNDGSSIGMNADEMLHISGKFSRDGLWGRGIIAYARESVGAGIAQERHGAAYFGSGAQPKGVLSTPGLKQKEDRAQYRREWREVHGSPDSAEIMIVPKESTYTPISLSMEDNQFIQSKMFSRSEIANWYDLPHYMLGEKDTAANVEQKGIDFVVNCLHPWAVRQEQQFGFKLLTRGQRQTIYCQLDFSALLRGDITTRYNAYRIAISSGFMTINQALRLEHQNGIGPAGDEYYLPANLITAKQMAQGGGGQKPPGSDHSGAPADDPNYYEPKALTRIQRSDLTAGLKVLEDRLPERPNVDLLAAARLAIEDVLARMFGKEAMAATKEIEKKGGDFDRWMREFYAKHYLVMVDALTRPCAILAIAGVKAWERPENLAAWLRERSLELLRAMYDGDTRETMTRKLAAWPTERVGITIDLLLSESPS